MAIISIFNSWIFRHPLFLNSSEDVVSFSILCICISSQKCIPSYVKILHDDQHPVLFFAYTACTIEIIISK